jgi:SAM-dependent methyltransferase
MIHFDATCDICGTSRFEPFGIRSDGTPVVLCSKCRHGVVRFFQNNPRALYGDDYFRSASGGIGYENYSYTAEHSVAWAAALVQLLRPAGKILDIGCADGRLLQKLSGRYERFGIEPNERAANECMQSGISVVSADVLDKRLPGNYAEAFDVATAIAVFEHIPQFRGAIEAALSLLRPDGLLLFEVPIISPDDPADPWLRTSLEHIHYPTEQSIRYLFENEFGLRLAGSRLLVRNFAQTFVGLSSKSIEVVDTVEQSFNRWVHAPPSTLSGDEARFRFLFELIHAANSNPEVLALWHRLKPTDLNEHTIARILELWTVDVVSLRAAETHSHETGAYLRQVEEARDWHAGESSKRDDIIAALMADLTTREDTLRVLVEQRDWHEAESSKKNEIIEALNVDCERYLAESAQQDQTIDVFRAELKVRDDTFRSLMEEQDAQATALEDLRVDWKARGRRVDEIEASWSWRLTAPVRALGRFRTKRSARSKPNSAAPKKSQ